MGHRKIYGVCIVRRECSELSLPWITSHPSPVGASFMLRSSNVIACSLITAVWMSNFAQFCLKVFLRCPVHGPVSDLWPLNPFILESSVMAFLHQCWKNIPKVFSRNCSQYLRTVCMWPWPLTFNSNSIPTEGQWLLVVSRLIFLCAYSQLGL